MGRQPKPTNLKVLQGNPGKRPLNTNEPKARKGTPAAPECLTPEAIREWKRLLPDLEANQLLSHFDRAVFSAYCMSWGLMVQAFEAINHNRDNNYGGLLIECPDGGVKTHPYVQVFNKQVENTVKTACHFGFTPATRSKITAGDTDSKLDEMQALLEGYR